MYKVPFRQCYTNTLKEWAKYTFWCHVVLKVFPHCVDLGGDALKETYLQEPQTFFEQYENSIRRACNLPELGLSQ